MNELNDLGYIGKLGQKQRRLIVYTNMISLDIIDKHFRKIVLILMRIAFFDVDQTIIFEKSIFNFLNFYMIKKNKSLNGHTYEDIISILKHKELLGYSRVELNRLYYSFFKDEEQRDIKEIAFQLFEERPKNYFKNIVLDILRTHLSNKNRVVLVSGASPDILAPLAKFLGVSDLLCSTPEVLDGKYTGNLFQQAICKGKSKLIRKYAKQAKINLADCFAYGDHISDLPMLKAVGYSCVVDPDKKLALIAKTHNWKIIRTD